MVLRPIEDIAIINISVSNRLYHALKGDTYLSADESMLLQLDRQYAGNLHKIYHHAKRYGLVSSKRACSNILRSVTRKLMFDEITHGVFTPQPRRFTFIKKLKRKYIYV